MRRLLILLVVVAPIVLASPSFWALVAMEFGAAPVTYYQRDGTSREALLGPMAPWPSWATVPDEARLTVKSWFGPSGKEPATGAGDLAFAQDARAAAQAYARKLRDEGWTVETYMFQAGVPSLLAPYIHSCVVSATRSDDDQRLIHAGFELAPNPGTASLHWFEATPTRWAWPRSGPC